MASRARQLADYLDAAVPLSLAFQRSGLGTSPDIQLAADMGESTGTLGPSLRRAVEQLDNIDVNLRPAFEKSFYFGLLAFWALATLAFLMLKIVPTFEEMFMEFDLMLPKSAELLIAVSRFLVEYWYVFAPLLLLICGGIVVGVLSYLGVSFHAVPLVNRIWSPVGSAVVLQMLSVAVSLRRPISETLTLMARSSLRRNIQNRLNRAERRIAQGMHWCDALQKVGLISRATSHVFRAAERAGNLAWALQEMADSTLRRTALKTRAFINALFPFFIALFGLIVLFIATGILLPLFDLISALS
jgi:type II secretory pathway component PulF